jgi:hypothetical protein
MTRTQPNAWEIAWNFLLSGKIQNSLKSAEHNRVLENLGSPRLPALYLAIRE